MSKDCVVPEIVTWPLKSITNAWFEIPFPKSLEVPKYKRVPEFVIFVAIRPIGLSLPVYVKSIALYSPLAKSLFEIQNAPFVVPSKEVKSSSETIWRGLVGLAVPIPIRSLPAST